NMAQICLKWLGGWIQSAERPIGFNVIGLKFLESRFIKAYFEMLFWNGSQLQKFQKWQTLCSTISLVCERQIRFNAAKMA
ncbi:MAG: hypothetical protein ACK559_03690, partial [bacterium]